MNSVAIPEKAGIYNNNAVIPAKAGIYNNNAVIPAKAGIYNNNAVIPAKAGIYNNSAVIPAQAGIQSFLLNSSQPHSFESLIDRAMQSNHQPILEANPSCQFPATDISSLEKQGSHLLIKCNFLGLGSVDCPLPPYMSQLARREGGKAWKDFLNRLNGIFYDLFYRASLVTNAISHEADYGSFLQQLTHDRLQRHELKWTPLFLKSTRTLFDLEELLKNLFPGHSLVVSSWIPIWIQNADASTCNEHSALDQNAVLGLRTLTISKTVAITVQFTEGREVSTLYHDTEKLAQIHSLLSRFLFPEYHYRLYFEYSLIQKQSLALGIDRISLEGFEMIGCCVQRAQTEASTTR